MLRRPFLTLCVLSPILAVLGATGLRARAHPRFYSVSRGHRGTCYCNSVEVKRAFACKTGRKGWVKYYVTDDSGSHIVKDFDAVTDYLHGVVRFEPLAT